MRKAKRTYRWVVVALAVAALPSIASASTAKRLGRPYSAYSASLFGKTNLNATQTQTLCADPENPLFGSTSVQYDVGVVNITGYGFAQGYKRWGGTGQEPTPESGAAIEVQQGGERFMVDLAQYLESEQSSAVETGYVQMFWQYDGESETGHYIPEGEKFLGFNSASTEGVDTHFFTFAYKEGVPDEVPASYRVYDETVFRGTGNRIDFMAFGDPTKPDFTEPGEIVDAVISGTVVPEPATAGLLLVAGGMALMRRSRRQA